MNLMTRNDLRANFASEAGQNVLLWILHEHHVFSRELKTDQEIALHNWGMKLISMIGSENKQGAKQFMQFAMTEGKT